MTDIRAAAIGDNRGPLLTEQELIARHHALFARTKGLTPPAAVTAETLDAANAFVKSVRELAKEIEAARKAEKAPIDAAGKVVQAVFLPYLNGVEACQKRAETAIGAHLADLEAQRRAEAAKRAAELAEQEKQRLAEAAQAEAEGDEVTAAVTLKQAEQTARAQSLNQRRAEGSMADLARTQTESGTATLRKVRVVRIIDRAAFNKAHGGLAGWLDDDAIIKAGRAMWADMPEGAVPVVMGLAFDIEHQAMVR